MACSKDTPKSPDQTPVTESKIVFSAEFEQSVTDTKTTLENDSNVLWAAGDEIKIFDSAKKSAIFTADQAGAKTTFTQQSAETGFNAANAVVAFYPASFAGSYDGTKVTFTTPTSQAFSDGSFASGTNPAIAEVSIIGENASMQFKNAFGVIKFKLKGTAKVKKIILTDKAGGNMNGTFTAQAGTTPTITYGSGATSAITLDCGAGVQLSSTEKTFYFTIPAGTLSTGFDARIIDENDYAISTLSTSKTTFVAQRNYVRKVAVQTVASFADAYDKGSYLDTDNGAYIKTGVYSDQLDWTCEAQLKYNSLHESCLLGCADVSGSDAVNRIYFFSQGSTSDTSSAAYGMGFARGTYYNPKTGSFNQLKPNTTTTYTISSANNNGSQVCTVNSTTYWNKTYSATVSTREFYAFGDNRGGTAGKFVDCNCYYLNIKHNGEYVRKFIPAKRKSDNKAGMYDTIEGGFYPSASSTNFIFH